MSRSKRKRSARAKAAPAAATSGTEHLEELPEDDEATGTADEESGTALDGDDAPVSGDDAPRRSTLESDDTDGERSEVTPGARRRAKAKGDAAGSKGKDPESEDATGKDPARRKRSSTSAATGEVGERAKDASRSTAARKPVSSEGARRGRRVAAASQMNPQWLAPTAVALLILGLVYLVTYYLSAGTLPLPIGDWNLAAGFGLMMMGGGMLMFWK